MAHHYRCGEAQRLELASLDYPQWLQECSSAAEKSTVSFEGNKIELPVHQAVEKQRARVLWDPCCPQLGRCSAAFGTFDGSKQSATGATLKLNRLFTGRLIKKMIILFSVFSTNVNCAQRSRVKWNVTGFRWWQCLSYARWNNFALFIQYRII